MGSHQMRQPEKACPHLGFSPNRRQFDSFEPVQQGPAGADQLLAGEGAQAGAAGNPAGRSLWQPGF